MSSASWRKIKLLFSPRPLGDTDTGAIVVVGHSSLFRFSAIARLVEQVDEPHLKQDLDKFKS